MKKSAKFFLIFFILILLIVGIGFSFYYFKLFPQFNSFIDSMFNIKTENVQEVVEEEEQIVIPMKKLPIITGINYVIQSDSIQKSNTNEVLEDYSLPNINLALEENGYVLSVSGEFAWKAEFEYPVVSVPCIFGNKIGLITADNQFLLLNLNSGYISDKLSLGVICDLSFETEDFSNIYLTSPFYDFTSVEGTKYSVILNSEDTYDFSVKPVEPEKVLSPLENFTPSKEIKENIISYTSTWGTDITLETFPKLKFFTEENNLLIDNEAVNFYLYSPKEQGRHSIGLMNENGSFINDNAVVALFKEDGTFVEVSLDYDATEPNIDVHLSNNELYYIVTYRIVTNEDSLEKVFLGAKKAL